MKKLLALLMALLLCMPALAETADEPVPQPEATAEPEAAQEEAAQPTDPLAPFTFTVPTDVTIQHTPGDMSVTFVHGNNATRVVAMVLTRVPDEDGDHAAELRRLMSKFAPNASDGVEMALIPGFYGLMAVTPGAFTGVGNAVVDQVTAMVLWQTALRAELLILSGYDMTGETLRTQTMIDMLLRSVTVNDAPIMAAELPADAEPSPADAE